MNKFYPIQSSILYKLRNRRKLAKILKLSPTFFRKDHEYKYFVFPKTKKDGSGKRQYSVPQEELKQVQKRLCKLLTRIEIPQWVISGKKGCDYVTNAQKHLEKSYVKTMDISHFYESASPRYIYCMFVNTFKMESDIARLVTKLVTYNGKIPTGSPSSQAVIFWAYRDMFENINKISDKYGCDFTLYVDDMTFSSDKPIPRLLREEVAAELIKHGLKAKARKDHYYQGKDVKLITGVRIKNSKMKVPNKLRKNILDQYKKCLDSHDIVEIERLKGMLNSARKIEPEIFHSIMHYVSHYREELRELSQSRVRRSN